MKYATNFGPIITKTGMLNIGIFICNFFKKVFMLTMHAWEAGTLYVALLEILQNKCWILYSHMHVVFSSHELAGFLVFAYFFYNMFEVKWNRPLDTRTIVEYQIKTQQYMIWGQRNHFSDWVGVQRRRVYF